MQWTYTRLHGRYKIVPQKYMFIQRKEAHSIYCLRVSKSLAWQYACFDAEKYGLVFQK